MKKILFTVYLLISCCSYSQSIIDLEQVEQKFPNGVGGYFSEEGKLLFGGSGFDSSSAEVNKVSFYKGDYFEGDLFSSNSIQIKWYCDSDGELLGYKSIGFLEYDKNASNPNRKSGKGNFFRVGTNIEFWKSGRIKEITHY
jgi:hypothetical protein